MASEKPSSTSSSDKAAEAPGCPVDHSTRAAWLAQHQGQSHHPTSPASTSTPPTLSTQRETSTIPRVPLSSTNGNSENNPHLYAASPSTEGRAGGGKDGLGNWIYPSEKMFFEAMKRKSHDPKAEDMRMIVPIHNAVNEKAWAEIKEWEKGMGSEKCGGPKLLSFSGDSKNLSPKARFFTLLGYQPPFDRHDWVVDRCGQNVEYIIDFYAGKKDPRRPEMPSFYLDVRPKLTVEGARMRVGRWVGSWLL